MEQKHHRGEWGSNFGFLMAAVGSAVGLGNIWGFPYKMGASGGFPFLVIYLALAVLVGFPIMLSELAIGRKAGRSVIISYQQLGGKLGGFVGWLALLSPFLILSFYTVLGGYCVEYMVLNVKELIGLSQASASSGADTFGAMLTNQPLAVLYTVLFIAACVLIIRGGIKDGIEKFNKVGMPALFVMLLIVIVRSVTLPGAIEGLKFMFAPNFSLLKEDFLGVLSAAGGQMFFSLSLAMGITVTYGSYLSKQENLVKNSLLIIVSDTIVAILAGVAVLPAAFALGGADAALAGPKLLFITLQDVFTAMGAAGPIFGILFYGLVVLAAITSTVALVEVLVTVLADDAAVKGRTPNRPKIVVLVGIVVALLASLVAVDGLGSNGLWIPFQSTGRNFSASWLDFMDCISEGIAMPLGALLMSVLVGWIVGPKAVEEEVRLGDNQFVGKLRTFYAFCICVVAPLGMAFILYGQLVQFFSLA
ncbi:MAG: sodium-dependent transporter [Lawsonibacter sp.]|nr:sodium-dependent transporter [Lawsonibacter sp.]